MSQLHFSSKAVGVTTTSTEATVLNYLKKGDLNSVRQYIPSIINVEHEYNYIQNSSKKTALMIGAIHGHVDIVAYLLSQHADVNKQSDFGDTALMLVCEDEDCVISETKQLE